MSFIEIGRSRGKAVKIDVAHLRRTRGLVTANSGGGKSWMLRRMAEQLFGKIPVWSVDPEGEFATLRKKFAFFLVGKGGDTPADVRSAPLLVEKLRQLNASVVFDLYDLKPPTRHAYVRTLCATLMNLPKSLWRPVVFMLDEAHVFGPEKGQGESEAFSDVQDIATRGRKRGICMIAYTQRLARISKTITAELLNRFVGMTREGIDIDSATVVLSVSREDREEFRDGIKKLKPGEFYSMGPAVANDRILMTVGGVQTPHPEIGEEYAATPPPPPEKIRALLPELKDLPKEVEEKAKTETELRAQIRSLQAQLAARPKVEVQKKQISEKPSTQRIIEVEVPVVGKREIRKLEKLVDRMEKAKSGFGFSTQALDMAARSLASVVDRMDDPTTLEERRKSAGLPPLVEKKLKPAAPPPKPQKRAETDTGLCDDSKVMALEKPARAVLSLLANYPEGCTIGKIALLTGYRQSGGFKNALSSLRTAGFMDGQNTGTMKLTEAGMAVSSPAVNLIGQELVDFWLNHSSFELTAKRSLKALVEHPDGLTIDEIAKHAGYEISGGFKNGLSDLRTAGVISGKNGERMRLCEELLEAVAS